MSRATAVTGGIAAVAWALLLAGYALSFQHLISHDVVVEHTDQALPVAALLIIAAWQVMIGAMMLPTVLPTVDAFERLAPRPPRPWPALAVFLVAYFAVWTAFGVAALAGDTGVHELVHRWGWLEERPSLVTAAVLVLAGVYQFLPVKRRCLAECRDPVGLLSGGSPPAGHGPAAGAWRSGVRHAVACLGSSWAIMLVMFAVGTHTLWLIVVLTLVLVAEKTSRIGPSVASLVGVALIAAGALAAT